MARTTRPGLVLLMGTCVAGLAMAAEGMPAFNDAALGLWWVLPFAGLLLSIAALPQLLPRFWHQHFGKVAAA